MKAKILTSLILSLVVSTAGAGEKSRKPQQKGASPVAVQNCKKSLQWAIEDLKKLISGLGDQAFTDYIVEGRTASRNKIAENTQQAAQESKEFNDAFAAATVACQSTCVGSGHAELERICKHMGRTESMDIFGFIFLIESEGGLNGLKDKVLKIK